MKGLAGFLAAVCFFAAPGVVGQPVTPAPAAAPATEGSDHLVRAEAPVVAGNVLSAKKRALSDAFRQSAERAFADILRQGEPVAQPWPSALTQLKASLASGAQKFVRSYRLVEQSNEGGVVKVMVEADVDTEALRREIDRARGGSTASAAQPPKAPSAVLVAGTGHASTAVVRALVAAGVSAQLDRAAGEPQLIADGAQRNAHALFVAESDSDEGAVRGAVQISVKCSLAARLFVVGAPTGRPVLDQVDEDRGFGADANLAREACVERTAALLARAVAAKLKAPAPGASFVTVQLDVSDPGAIALVLQACKRMGSVTATEARQVSAKSAELRVFTRMGGPALQQALARELAGKLAMVPTQTASDVLALRLRAPDASSLE